MIRNEGRPLNLLLETPTPADVLEEVAPFISPGESVLDIGSGLTAYSERLAAAQITCRRIAFEAASSELETGSRDYDVVTLLNLPASDPVPMLRKARELLRPGGRLAVSGPSSGVHGPGGSVYSCSAEGMEALLKHLRFTSTLVARPDLCLGRVYLVISRV